MKSRDIREGQIYTNGKGTFRKVLSISPEGTSVRQIWFLERGEHNRVELASFARWAVRKAGPPEEEALRMRSKR